MTEASFDFQMADRQIRRIVTRDMSHSYRQHVRENHNQFCVATAFSYLAAVLVRALRGIQSPAGGKTEISLP
jgi:hypothetical protein